MVGFFRARTHRQAHKHEWRVESKALEKYPVSRDFAPHKVNFKKLDTRHTVAYCAFGAQTKLTSAKFSKVFYKFKLVNYEGKFESQQLKFCQSKKIIMRHERN